MSERFNFSFDPFAEFGSYREALRQLIEGGWILPRDLMPSAVTAVVVSVDVLDTGPEIVVQANLPGVKAEDVSISVVGTTLTIKGTITPSTEYPGATYLHRERKTTGYVRSMTLPSPVDVDKAEARVQNGVLTLTLPKSEIVRPKTIHVTGE